MFKRIFYSILAVLMAALGVAAFLLVLHHDPQARTYSNDDTDKSMFIERAAVVLKVDERGTLKVSEMLQYDLGSNAWHGLYQDVILAGGEQPTSVSVARVEGDQIEHFGPGSGIKLGVGGAYGTYGYGLIKDPDRRLRIVWNVNDTGRKSFLITYTLKNAVKNFQDASTLLWDVWGRGWETGVGELSAVVVFPGRIKLFQPRAGELQSRVSDTLVDGNLGRFKVVNIPQKRQVQVRVAARPLTAAPRQTGDVMPKLRAESAEIARFNAEQAKESAELKDRRPIWFVIRTVIGALLALLLVALCARTIGRDSSKPISAGGSYQYPPEKLPPPVAGKVFGGGATDDLVSSVLLGFLQRDVFRVLPSVEKKEDVSIRNLVGETTFDRAKVADYEAPIAELLQSAIDKHPEHSPDFTKLKKYLDARTAETKIAEFEKRLSAEARQLGADKPYRGLLRRWLIGIAAILLYVLAFLLVIAATEGGNVAARYDTMSFSLWLFGFAPVILWAAVEGNAFYVLRADQADRVRKWETYQDFFKKMDLSREYPLTVEIWDEALLYAAAFGFAKKVITNMPRTDASGTRVTDTSYNGIGWMAGSGFAASSFSNMSSGISGVTGMASSSSSGGGGFSGGGSGGGGGGGW
jgi:uncharacterized membrane protein YgcG